MACPFFKFCLVKCVSSNQEVGLKEVWTICGGVICRKYSRYEAQVKARHNLLASQSLPLASKCFLLSSSSVLVFSKSKKRDVGGGG
jgi:hypothetical protein